MLPKELQDDTGDIHFVPAPCQAACPIGTDAPSYLAYIWEGDLEGAFETITATNPFSSICGRVCDAPCEPACRRADSDGPIAIRNLKRFVMDKLGKGHWFPESPITQTKTIGIVGSGPTGLTAAQDLAQAGYEVHVYEMTDRLGGMMVWGIPAFRLPPGIIQEDIDRMLHHCPGIKIHLNCALGKDITLDELKEKHDAVLLSIGAWWGKTLGIEGEELSQVIDGVGFLRKVNAGERPTLPETVVVLGGGDVAMDACRAALRLPGCEKVKVVYRRGPNEIPARRDELEGAIKEGIEFVYYTQPVKVVEKGDGLGLVCLLTELKEADADGRRRPVAIEGSEHEIDCGMVIAAVGQKTECDELEDHGLMNTDRVKTDFETMRSADAKVFAAGDGAFGPSTIVQAMYHGHRGAYYLKAFLEGETNPLPYRTPFRTHRVAVSQDPQWERINRQEQPFHGVGKEPMAFGEIESTYTLDEARNEAARCYRCDAENGSAEYTVQNREDIFRMARTQESDERQLHQILDKRLLPRENPFPQERGATLDDICFLPANLSRLVIDPYREACKTKTDLGDKVQQSSPFLVCGFDDAPLNVKKGLARALEVTDCLYMGQKPLLPDAPWIQLVSGDEAVDPQALGVIYVMGNSFSPAKLSRCGEEQLLGVAVGANGVEEAIPFVLENDCELLLLDTTGKLMDACPELGAMDLCVVPKAIHLLRKLKSEEKIDLIYFGGVRSGTDAAKTMAMGCSATVLSLALALSVGGSIENNRLCFTSDISVEESFVAAENFIRSCVQEVSMMARCAGKTNIHSLEPEDLRAITLATAEATQLPLSGTKAIS